MLEHNIRPSYQNDVIIWDHFISRTRIHFEINGNIIRLLLLLLLLILLFKTN